MLRCQAIVTQVDAQQIELSVNPQPACGNCAKGRGCGMALFERKPAARLRQPLNQLQWSAVSPVAVGRSVELQVAAGDLLRMALRVYLFPLGLAVLLASSFATWGDLPALLGLLGGLAAGYLCNRIVLARASLLTLSMVSHESDPVT